MKRLLTSYLLTLLAMPLSVCMPCSNASAQDDQAEIEPTPWYENEPQYENNLGALNTGDTSADIISEGNSEDVSGAQKGEITLRLTEMGVDIYSGLNKVEAIVRASDGWTGAIEEETTSHIIFHPSGRPELKCPKQDLANWYGPCKLAE